MSEEKDSSIEEEPIKKETQKLPSVFRNYISLIGAVLAVTSLVSIVLLLLLEWTSSSDQPYLGILIYILLPAVMIFGLTVFLLGGIWERWRRRKMSPEEILAYPILDLNGPRRRKMFFAFLFCSFIFLMISAFGSYKAFEFSESVTFCGQLCHTVMNPEYQAYLASPHSQIKCVECHVGSGADNYLRAKFNGVRQLYLYTIHDWEAPIPTPVKTLRNSNETCGKCHWTEKYYGEQLRVFNHYGYDENNSLNQTRMLIRVGGGSPSHGQVGGIHWHMNLGNDVQFISSDEKRQNIQWVRMTDKDGKTVEYFAKDANLTPDQIAAAAKRKMDCTDCHNRPTHIFLSPNQAIDQALDAKRMDVSLPYLKMKGVEILGATYNTNEEAMTAITTQLPEYYKTNYPDVYASKKVAIDAAAAELQNIYRTYFFPEMKADWKAHQNNIGHFTAQGCFRCHNGEVKSKEGKAISNDCATCHATLDQTFGGKTITPADGYFQHPLDLGEVGKYQCAGCHSENKPFKHPVNLGDISKFKCAECHQGNSFKINK